MVWLSLGILFVGSLVVFCLLYKKDIRRGDNNPTANNGAIANLTPQAPIKQALSQLLREAEIGSLWIIRSFDERGRHVFSVFVRGDLDDQQLDGLSRRDVVAFDKGISIHRRTLVAFMNRHDGPLARLANSEDIGWAGAELIRRCHQWGLIGGGLMAAFRNIVATRPRRAESTATETSLARLEQILAPSQAAPIRRESQIFNLSG